MGKLIHEQFISQSPVVFLKLGGSLITDKTQAYTAGVNYYIKGYDAKIQANYIWVDEPSDGTPTR